MSLPSSIQRVGDAIVAFYDRPVGDGPYQLYQYLPSAEYRVRADLFDLKIWLESRGVSCAAVSLADLLWQAIDESGRLEAIVSAEKSGSSTGLDDAIESVGSLMRRSPSLADRVVSAVEESPASSAVFLYRAGALYPVLRTSGLLDDLMGRVRQPVTLLYPGRLHGERGLSFMDVLDPHYGYRPTIISRGDDE